MAELAHSSAPAAIGCTQVTEINYTPGVVLVGTLPKLFELATLYSAAVCARAANEALARRFVERITGETTRELRIAAGFEERV
jgi:molybdate transport system substrate-binding protein